MASSEVRLKNASAYLRMLSSNEGSMSRSSSKVKVLNELANELKLMKEPSVIRCITPAVALKCLRVMMSSANVAVRAATLRALRYLMVSEELLQLVYAHRLELLICFSLDHDSSNEFESERLQAIKLMRVMLLLSPSTFPMACCRSLVAIGETSNNSHHRSALTIICELATLNPQLVCACGGMRAILSAAITIQIPSINEALVQTVVRLMNFPETRVALRYSLDLDMITAPLLDADYKHSLDSVDSPAEQAMNEKLEHLNGSYMAVIWMLRTWPGLVYLCRAEETNTMSALIDALPCPNENVQFAIMDIIYQALHIRVPSDTDNFDLALESIEYSAPQESWSLDRGWLAEEARCTLLPRRTHRLNFMHQYHALLLRAFVNRGLLERLAEVALSDNPLVQVHGVVLLGEIQARAALLLPAEEGYNMNCLPSLVGMAVDPNVDPVKRQRATAVMAQLERIQVLRKRPVTPASPYLTQVIQRSPEVADLKMKFQVDNNQHEIDDAVLLSMVKDATGNSSELEKWNWSAVSLLLRTPGVTFKRLEELAPKCLRRITYFFMPSAYLFSTESCSADRVAHYSRVGVELVKFLVAAGSEEPQRFLLDIMQEIMFGLSELLQPPTAGSLKIFAEDKVAKTMTRDYFLFIGQLSTTRAGIDLLQKLDAFKILLDLCDLEGRTDIQRLIIASLDYSHDSYSRIILTKLLTCGSKEVRQYTTRHMRVFFRAGVNFFRSFIMELLVGQLYDSEPDVAEEALDVLDEACQDDLCLKALISLQPALLHLGPKGRSLFLRFLSVPSGFQLLKTMNFITSEIESWFQRECQAYVVSAETQILQMLSSFKPLPEGHYARRGLENEEDQFAPHVSQLLLPVHLYGELCQQREGLNMLVQAHHIPHFVMQLESPLDSARNIQRVKAAVWALCHIGSSTHGMEVLEKENAIRPIIRLAENSPVYSLRGTCTLALSLLARRSEGCSVLEEHGWVATRTPAGNDLSLDAGEGDEDDGGDDVFEWQDSSVLESPSFSLDPAFIGGIKKSASVVLPDASSTGSSVGQTTPRASIVRRTSAPFSLALLPSSITCKSPVLGSPAPQSPYQPGNARTPSSVPRRSSAARINHSASDRNSSGSTMASLQLFPKLTFRKAKGFIGVCLPTDIQRLLKCEPVDFSYSYPVTGFNEMLDRKLAVDNLHTEKSCLKCCVHPASGVKHVTDESEQAGPNGSYSKITTDPTSFECTSSDGRHRFRKEMVKLIVKLSCPVGSRATQQIIIAMKDQCPAMFKDICLYTQVADLLGIFHYRYHVRVFVQGLFDVSDSLKA